MLHERNNILVFTHLQVILVINYNHNIGYVISKKYILEVILSNSRILNVNNGVAHIWNK